MAVVLVDRNRYLVWLRCPAYAGRRLTIFSAHFALISMRDGIPLLGPLRSRICSTVGILRSGWCNCVTSVQFCRDSQLRVELDFLLDNTAWNFLILGSQLYARRISTPHLPGLKVAGRLAQSTGVTSNSG